MNNHAVRCSLVLALVMTAGCGDRDEQSYTGPHRTGTAPETVRAVANPDFFPSESDPFHPGSRFESVRKNRLTDFGLRDVTPPVETPNSNVVQQLIYDDGFDGLMVTGFQTARLKLPAFPFDYENDIARLKRLASDHHLDQLAPGADTELDQLIALMTYTAGFFEGGTPPPPEDDKGPSAEYLTTRRRERNIGGTSRDHAALFCQLALSLGYTARMVGMHATGDDGGILSHTACEVFMNQFNKWVLFDPAARATYYMRGGAPQSALELRNIMLDGNYRAIQAYPQFGDITTTGEVKEDLLPRYRYLYTWRMNDILSKSPRGGTMSWQEFYEAHLVWEDARALIRDGRFEEVPVFNDDRDSGHPLTGVRFAAHETDEFYWPSYRRVANRCLPISIP